MVQIILQCLCLRALLPNVCKSGDKKQPTLNADKSVLWMVAARTKITCTSAVSDIPASLRWAVASGVNSQHAARSCVSARMARTLLGASPHRSPDEIRPTKDPLSDTRPTAVLVHLVAAQQQILSYSTDIIHHFSGAISSAQEAVPMSYALAADSANHWSQTWFRRDALATAEIISSRPGNFPLAFHFPLWEDHFTET
jgi:hypothetical protein